MKYGLIGRKLSHSYSPQIHSFFGNEDYKLLELEPNEVIDYLKSADFSAINVTIPYKETVMPYCVLSPQASLIGSVNTIVNRDGKLFGYNTDYFGFSLMASRANIDFKDKKVLILGSGGTCKTAISVIKDCGAKEIITISRNGENNYSNIQLHSNADIIVNTTPIGMYPNSGNSPIDLKIFNNLSGVIDAIYNPLNTKLIIQAQKMGIPSTGGLPMLVSQGLMAHNLFFDVDHSFVLDSAIEKAEKLFRNIVLVGMPGCGKTTIGKIISEKYSMDFVDSDEIIQKNTGKTPCEIILEKGEEEFRIIETEVIKKLSSKTGQVISTGGGSIIKEENREALLQNGTIIYLERKLEKLCTKDRPLSCDLGVLLETRKSIYEEISQYKIEVCDEVHETIENIDRVFDY